MGAGTLGVIPARGGSKRIPRKNVRQVGGKPLIAHTIEQTANSTRLDHTVVSTDDEEIAATARQYGGTVPFERPAELATDTASSVDVVLHALDWFKQSGTDFDTVVMVQVTTPFRTTDDIDGAIERLEETDAGSIVGITEFQTPPAWAMQQAPDGRLRSYLDDEFLWGAAEDIPRSQDVPELYYPNGVVFAANVDTLRREQNFYMDDTVGYEIPPARALDIDEPFELRFARALFEYESDGRRPGSGSGQ